MIINHNIAALNTLNRLNAASNAQSKSMQKLSSGLRINSAADDAAGLAISEKMRAQIRGLDQATRNAQDGISLIQTAEGALNETHDILQRMRELAVQSSNDTNTDEDRASIQTEISQLKDEIDRIGNTTEFNTKKLIDGSIGAKTLAGSDKAAVISSALGKETAAVVSGAVPIATGDLSSLIDGTYTLKVDGANINVSITASDYTAFDNGSNVDTAGLAAKLQEDINKGIEAYNKANGTSIANVSVTASNPTDGKISIQSGSVGNTSTITIDNTSAVTNDIWDAIGISSAAVQDQKGSEGVFTAAGAAQVQSINPTDVMNVTIDGTEIAVTLSNTGNITASSGTDMATTATALQNDINSAINNYNSTVPADKRLDNVTVSVKDGALVVESGSSKTTSSLKFDNSDAAQLLGLAKQDSATQGGGIDFQIGANQTQTMKITIEDMRSEALGVKDIDVSTKAGAQEAITKINDAIEKVSTQRSNLGAYQNRLEHTINNLGTSSENLTAAESRIRDVDMAKEMMEQTKSSILAQAAQAMLAQANQQPQGVLQLLR